MKKYAVLKSYKTAGIAPDVVQLLDTKQDAFDLCDILHRANGYDYFVFQLIGSRND